MEKLNNNQSELSSIPEYQWILITTGMQPMTFELSERMRAALMRAAFTRAREILDRSNHSSPDASITAVQMVEIMRVFVCTGILPKEDTDAKIEVVCILFRARKGEIVKQKTPEPMRPFLTGELTYE